MIPARCTILLALLCGACVTSKEYKQPPSAPPQPRLPRNDVYEGSVLTGKLTPRFVWEAPADGAFTYELQYSPDAKFETDVTAVETAELTYQPDAPLPVSTVPPVGRRYYWRVRACLSDVCSEFSRPWWINLGRSAKDFNGDGYADVAVGEPLFFNGSGRVHIFFGGPGSPFDETADGIITIQGSSEFGIRLAPGRDSNGDGFADLLIAASQTAYLYFGGPGGTFIGSIYTTFPGPANEDFGAALVADDFDADGLSDVAIGAPSNSAAGASSGRVYMYFGGAMGSTSIMLNGERADERLGAYLSGGDMNGDGFADLAVTAGSFSDQYHAGPCLARLYRGGAPQSMTTDDSLTFIEDTRDMCSFRAIVAGDLNRDGFADLVSGLNIHNSTISVYPGQSTIDMKATYTGLAAGSGVTFSSSLAAVGDINGDMFSDFMLVGEYGGDLYYGKADARAPLYPVAGVRNEFFWHVVGAGDLNGDGFDDLLQRGNPTQVYFGSPGATFDGQRDGALSTAATGTGFGVSIM